MNKKTEKNLRKLSVLDVIQEKKKILFGRFSQTLTNTHKESAWKEVLQRAQALELATAEKKWTFARDQLWGVWKCRALAKRDNSKKTGSGGGKESKMDDVDYRIYEILDNQKDLLDGLGLPESQPERSPAILIHPENLGCSFFGESSFNDSSVEVVVETEGIHPKRKLPPSDKIGKKKRNKLNSETREELKNKLIRTETYYRQLKCFELEQRLGLQTSEFTREIAEKNAVIICESEE